jgi:type I restriction enzyme M protein
MEKLTPKSKQKIINYIQLLDPKGELVTKLVPNEDWDGGTIEYNKSKLKLHREISQLNDEEYVRAYLVVKLVRELTYASEYVELEKEYEAGRPKIIKPRIDIIVKTKDRQSTFLFIEVKSQDKYEQDKSYIEGQLFKLAQLEGGSEKVKYLVYYSVYEELQDKALIIDYPVNKTYEDWGSNGFVSLDRLPKEYGIARKAIYVNKDSSKLEVGEKNLDRKVSKERFLYLRRHLHDVLWGGGGMFYNEIFSNLVKLFLTKIYDEETTPYGKPYRFQIEFKDGHPEAPRELYKKINILFKESQKVYLGLPEEIVEGSVGIDTEKISENKIAYVVESLEGISLLENENIDEGDVLGDFFEGIVSEGFKQDKGQFFTHPNIVSFVLHILGIDELATALVSGKENPAKPRLPFICDPACGSGTFLIESMKLITKSVLTPSKVSRSIVVDRFIASNFPKLKENTWAREYIYGVEINSDLALATKVNMVLHGDGSINIFAKDGLLPFSKFEIPSKVSILAKSEVVPNYSYKYEVNEGFDVVISNPPFAIDLDNETKRTLPQRFLNAQKANSENLFIERWFQLLRENGRFGVVLPESFFDTSENMYIRLFLYKYFKVIAVVSLPGGKNGAFTPYTGTKTNLLFAQKKTREEVELFEKHWRTYSREFQKTKRVIDSFKKEKSKLDDDEFKKIIKRYLRHLITDEDLSLSISDLLKKYKDEIADVGRHPEWWVFGEVAKELDYRIFMAIADEIGYKRTIRGEQKRPNFLFQADERNQVIIDIEDPKTILDYFKSRKIPEHNGRVFEVRFSEISNSLSLRFDVRLHKYLKFELPQLLNGLRRKAHPLRNAIKLVRNGKDIKRASYSDDETEYVYLTVNNIKPERIALTEVIHILGTRGVQLEKHKLQKGEVILTRSGTVGVCRVFDIEDGRIFIPSGYLTILRIDENIVRGKFLELYLNSTLMRPYFNVFGTGKTQRNIAQTDIRNIPIPAIPVDEQDAIVTEIAPLLGQILAKETEIAELRAKAEASFGKMINN